MSTTGNLSTLNPSLVTGKKRFNLSLFATLILVGLVVTNCQQGTLSRPLRIGFIENELSLFPLLLMKERGYLEYYKLTQVEWQSYPDSRALVTDLQLGRCDVGACELLSTLSAVASGHLAVTLLAPISLHGYCVLVRKQDRPVDFDWLIQHKIALAAQPSMEELLLLKAFATRDRVSPQLQIVSKPYSEMSHSLLDKEVDALFVPEPQSSILLQNPGLKLFYLSEKMWPDHPHAVLFTASHFVQERPDTVLQFLKAILETQAFMDRSRTGLVTTARKVYSFKSSLLATAIPRFEFSSKRIMPPPEEYISYLARQQGIPQKVYRERITYEPSLQLTAIKAYNEQKQAYYSGRSN